MYGGPASSRRGDQAGALQGRPDRPYWSPDVPTPLAIDHLDIESRSVGGTHDAGGADASHPRRLVVGAVVDETEKVCGMPAAQVDGALDRQRCNIGLRERPEVPGTDSTPGIDPLPAGVGAAECRVQLEPCDDEPERQRLSR